MMNTDKWVLGISGMFHDSAAAIVHGEKIVAAAQEERFTRKKGDSSFPVNAIDYCLKQIPENSCLDAISFYENPVLKLDRIITNAQNFAPRGCGIWPRTLRSINEISTKLPSLLESYNIDPSSIYFTNHHHSHAASAFFPSPFKKAAILVVDGVGEWATTSIWAAEKGEIQLLSEIHFPHSLGLFYSAFTQYCGFKVNSGEYKLMGLAPFGRPIYREKILKELIDVKADGSFTLNLKHFNFHIGISSTSPLFEYLFGQPARFETDPITQFFMDIACSVQAVTNEVMQRLANTALKQTGMRNLCLAGGVAQNCVSNSYIFNNSVGLDNIWIQPAPGDAGGALGSAMLTERKIRHPRTTNLRVSELKTDGMNNAFLGPEYSDEEIETTLQNHNLNFQAYTNQAERNLIAAQALSTGSIIGHFDGRMEFGPRALGNRSILADPRPEQMMDKVNRKIKFREGWRPFAPIVLEEFASKYFEEPSSSPYMLLVSKLKKQFRSGASLEELRQEGWQSVHELQRHKSSKFSAISHIDNTSRLQTIGSESGSSVYGILHSFYKLTNCPILLNTSFNVRGEPIICSPKDAIACFLNTNLDVLIIGPFVVRKDTQANWVHNQVGRRKFNAD